jgi:YVTN family beta-propeller protein
VVGEIPVFGFPRVMVVSPDSRWIYLTLRWLNGITVIDAEKKQVVAVLDLGLPVFPSEGKAAHGPGISPDGKYIYLTSQILNTVSVIDSTSLRVVRSIPVGMDPNWIDFSSDGHYAYVSNTATNNVSVIDTAGGKVVATVAVGQHPKRLAVAKAPVAASGN